MIPVFRRNLSISSRYALICTLLFVMVAALQRLQLDDNMKKHQIMHTFIGKTATNKLMTSKV